MGEQEQPDSGETGGAMTSDARDELRTIGFRMREIQRLLSMRVQQENRRLEADGLDPVAEATFFKGHDGRLSTGGPVGYLIQTLAGLDIFDEARVTLDDGTTIRGRCNPITYTPNERLRMEIRPRDEDERYDLRARYADDEWDTPVVRQYVDEDNDWTELGELHAIRAVE
ncbi:hypothetical protein ACFQH6_11740 [Halobacteriaceae archaeon GCM10025711]